MALLTAGAPRSARRHRDPSKPRWWVTLTLVSPFLVGLALFVAYPVVSTLYYSLTDFEAGSYRPVSFVGLRNYAELLGTDAFWTSAGNTLWMVLVMVPARTAFALLAAWVLTRLRRGAGVYRTLYFLPSMVPVVAASLAFVVALNPAGPVNALLARAGVPGPGWFTDPAWSKPSLVLMALWACGDVMVIFSAAMLDVPRDLLEAATLDGAGAWQRLRHVMLPCISPVVLFAVLTGMIYTFQYFTEAFVASSSSSVVEDSVQTVGYPQDSLLFYSTELYRQGFVYFRTGYASAMAWLLFLVVLACTLVFLRVSRGMVHHEGGAR